MAKKRNRITKLMSDTIAESSPLIKSSTKKVYDDSLDEIQDIDISLLKKNPYQPRIEINAASLNELISSIEANGLLQPIVITKNKDNSTYTIVAGHRRYEAHKIMGRHTIKSKILKDLSDKDLVVLSLAENLIREDLLPIENAISIKHILDQGIVSSQNKLAEYIGMSKGHISKMMTILNLPSSMIKLIKDSKYRDINVLVLINKLDTEDLMIQVFNYVQDLSRKDALNYIQSEYLNKEIDSNEVFSTKSSSSKITVQINIKNLDKTTIDMINTQLNELSNRLNNSTQF